MEQVESQQQPWESLDVDDSDIPSLLRPCKRTRPSTTNPSLSQNLNSQSIPVTQPPEPQPPTSTSPFRTIPGPAGTVQSALHRKNLDRQARMDFSDNDINNGVISTQDYIQRAMDDTSEFDDNFTLRPWLSALHFLGVGDGVVRSTPIGSIKAGKVDQVVVVIKSSTPDGHGGLNVMLKDPTGTVGGSIHHKVLSESEFGKNITTGAVLILQKVVFFAPVRSTYYLNITLRNLVKVFCQDSGSSSKPNNPAYPIQHDHPGIECRGKAKTLEKISTTQNSAVNNIANEKRECTRMAGNLQNISPDVRRGHINISQDACKKSPEDIIGTSTTGDHREFVYGSEKSAKGGEIEGRLLDNTGNMNTSAEKSTGEVVEVGNEGQTQRQSLILKSSLPQWTDEQLDELFAGDEVDDSLF